jgi:hypothetical protein
MASGASLKDVIAQRATTPNAPRSSISRRHKGPALAITSVIDPRILTTRAGEAAAAGAADTAVRANPVVTLSVAFHTTPYWC